MNVFVPNTKEDILKNVRNRTVFLSYYGSPKTLQTFFRKSFVFRTNTGLRVSKWWQNFIFVSLISVIILGQLGVRVCRACPSHTVSCSQFLVEHTLCSHAQGRAAPPSETWPFLSWSIYPEPRMMSWHQRGRWNTTPRANRHTHTLNN